MLLLAAVAVCVLSVPLVGRRLSSLADLQVRRGGALLAGVALQLILVAVAPDQVRSLGPVLHVASYGFAGWFVVANRRLPGLPVLALGAALNLAAIVANGGVMPASPAAVRAAGLELDAEGFHNSAPVEGADLAVLGDVFAVPAPLPLANVFSVGDVVLVVGAALALHGGSGPRRRRPTCVHGPQRLAPSSWAVRT